jgi:hypothetical protein
VALPQDTFTTRMLHTLTQHLHTADSIVQEAFMTTLPYLVAVRVLPVLVMLRFLVHVVYTTSQH